MYIYIYIYLGIQSNVKHNDNLLCCAWAPLPGLGAPSPGNHCCRLSTTTQRPSPGILQAPQWNVPLAFWDESWDEWTGDFNGTSKNNIKNYIYIYIILNNMIMNNIVNIKFVINKSKYYSKNIIKSLLTMNKY